MFRLWCDWSLHAKMAIMNDFQFILLTSLASKKGKMSKKKQENLLKAGNFFPPPGHAAGFLPENANEQIKIYSIGGYRFGAPTALDSLLVETTIDATEDNIQIVSAKSCVVSGSYKNHVFYMTMML